MIQRTAVVTVRLTDQERTMLRSLAEVKGVSDSDILRMLLREEHSRVFVDALFAKTPKPTKAPTKKQARGLKR